MLLKIKSHYIFQNIFYYTKHDILKLKLFEHSNLYQKLLGINLNDYKLSFLKQINPDINRYLFSEKTNDKNILQKSLKEDLLKYHLDIEIFKIYIDNYFKSLMKNINNVLIDISSPFFDFLSEKKYFGDIFTISINAFFIDKFNLKNEYISKFDKLNKLNIQYSSIRFNVRNNDDIYYLKDIHINYNIIKKLKLY